MKMPVIIHLLGHLHKPRGPQMVLDRDTMQHTVPIPSIGVHFQQVSMDQGDTNNTYLMILSILGTDLDSMHRQW
jgi:hypothetical protein